MGQSQTSRLEPRREILDNGIVLLWNESRDTPSVAIRGSFPAGSAREAVEKAGLAGLTARLLRRGTHRHSAQEISAVVEEVGASFSVWGGTEEGGFSAKCLDRDVGTVLDVLQEVLEQPAFAEDEIAKTRGEVLVGLREQEDSTRARADEAILRALFPEGHPYSRFSIGTRETVEALRQEDFRAFHASYYGAAGMLVSVAGALHPNPVRSRLGRWFPNRTGPSPQPDWHVTPSSVPQHARISMPHKSQVDIILAGPGIARHHPDFFALSLVNLILGGLGLMGRLGERVREQQGIAYHVSCRSTSRLWAGEWSASAGVAPANVDRAIQAILEEVQRVREERVSEEELQDARDYLIGSLPLRMETNDGIAGYLLNSEYYGLGMDYIRRYPGYILAESRESLREAARKHMDPATFSQAIAGPV
jgi:zinc protease